MVRTEAVKAWTHQTVSGRVKSKLELQSCKDEVMLGANERGGRVKWRGAGAVRHYG